MKRMRKSKGGLLLNSRWAAYTAAAAASTFGTAVAEAEIHYSGTIEEKIAGFGGASARFPLSNGASIRLYNYSHRIPSYSTAGFSILGAAVSHSFRAKYDPPFFGVGASRLHSGQLVSQGNFRQTNPSSTEGNIHSFYGGGNWIAGGRGVIGFKFNTGAGTQYGWVRIKIASGFHYRLTVVDYAWGDPGDTIKTGQIRGQAGESGAVPAEGSLGLLALGGAGLVAWRKNRARTAN